MKFCILGATKRSAVLAEKLSKAGHDVHIFSSADMLPEHISADCVVLPVPTLTKDGYLNLKGKMIIDDLFKKIDSGTLIISCNYDKEGCNIEDINKRDDFAYLNAVPTAEGAIHAAVSNCDRSLSRSKILVTGFGRVAQILSDRLKGLKCAVTVAARNNGQLAHAKALGFDTVDLKKLGDCIPEFDIIFQTVPAILLDKNMLSWLKKGARIIELSSGSRGTDTIYAAESGINLINAPSLPERVAPITAGEIFYECVCNIIQERQKGVK